MGNATSRMGNSTADTATGTCQKRDALQHEMAWREQKLQKETRRSQKLLFLRAWRGASIPDAQSSTSRRRRENAERYKKTRLHRKTTRGYVDCGNGEPFRRKQIEVRYDNERITGIRNSIHIERSSRKSIRRKTGLTGPINRIQDRWKIWKLEEETAKLQKSADRNNMRPIW